MLEASQKSKDEAGARQAEGAAQGPPMLSPSASSLGQLHRSCPSYSTMSGTHVNDAAVRANLTPQKSFKHVEMVDEVHETSRYAGAISPYARDADGAAVVRHDAAAGGADAAGLAFAQPAPNADLSLLLPQTNPRPTYASIILCIPVLASLRLVMPDLL
eukprot:2517593-Rhodomonas_salina.6